MSSLQIIILTFMAELALFVLYWILTDDMFSDSPDELDERLSAADDEIRNRPRVG